MQESAFQAFSLLDEELTRKKSPVRVSLTVSREFLERLERLAERSDRSKAQILDLALSEYLRQKSS